MARASELGMTHLAQTNHGTLSGHREFQRAANEAGIVPILGVEAYISATDRFDRRATNKREDGTSAFNHIGLLAMNENGLRNLNVLSSEAWHTGFYNKPRIDMELLEEHNEDIIVVSGCMNGLLSKALEQGNYELALERAKEFKRIFGDRFFIEIQGHNPPELNAGLMKLAEATGTLPVITSDCHYARKEDLWVEEAMLILSTNPKPASGYDLSKAQKMDYLERYNYLYPDRKMTFQEIEIYLHSAEEQGLALAAQGIDYGPVANTLVVANMIGEYPYYEALDLLPDTGAKDEDAALKELVRKGLEERGVWDEPGYKERALEELEVIFNKGFSKYFLILADVVQWARAQGIFIGPGRGSGVSSLVNYSLFITHIDPIPHKLLFFRFLDPDRDDWPDIDVDFEMGRRHEVKSYVQAKYGYVGNIMTIGYYRDKSSIKAAARVLKIPIGETNLATKYIDTMEDYETSGFTKEFREKYPEVLPLAKRIEGRIQNFGMHAGGTIISKEPLENYLPMQTAKDTQDESADRVSVVGVDMREAAEIGAIKYDFLGLATLTVILDTLKMIEQRYGLKIDPYDIPDDDAKMYEMLSAGFTKGVFQCEGGPYTNTILKMGGVWDFTDLVASNALVRPGAANSSIGENYMKGKNTGDFEYIHADTKYFTEETYGQILFQEQQMQLVVEVAGMSMKDANQVRQAISKKILEKLQVWEPAFVEGAAKKIGERKAQAVWNDLEASAKYAFNKAHSVGYSMLSLWTAWLKANYPLEYMTSLLIHEKDADKKLSYLMEAKRLGLKVYLPHVNESDIKTAIQGDGIRLGLSTVKYVGEKAAAKIIEQRPYRNYEHLMEVKEAKGSGINVRAIAALNKVGGAAFDDNPRTGNERENFYEYLEIPAFDSKDILPDIKAQFRPLDEFTEKSTFVTMAMVRNIKVGQGWALVDLVDETGTTGVFTDASTPIEKGRMYVMIISNNRIAKFITTDELVEGEGGAFAKYLEKVDMNLEEGEYRAVAAKTRKTKTGSTQIDAILTDKDKNLVPVMVFEKMIPKISMTLGTASKFKPVFGETRNGGLFIKEV